MRRLVNYDRLLVQTTSLGSYSPHPLSGLAFCPLQPLPDGDVVAALFFLVLDVTSLLLTQVAEHLGEDIAQGVVAYLAADGLVTVVADVEGGGVEVTGALGGIAVVGA